MRFLRRRFFQALRFTIVGATALVVAASSHAQPSPARQPFGIYAKPDINSCAAIGYRLQGNADLTKPNGWITNANTSSPTLSNGFYQVSAKPANNARFYRLQLP